MTIRWITPLLGTAAASAIRDVSDISIVDVRNLVDKAGNPTDVMREKIREGVESLLLERRTVICCDYGMSRSNAIATGVLASFSNISFDAALRKVHEATGETEIKLEPLNAVRKALGDRKETKRNTNQRSILVTGGEGFLGKALIATIGSGYRVVAPSSAKLDISLGSTQLDLLTAEEDIDCIVHLANPRVYTSNMAMGQSLTMLRNVIDVCLAKDIRLIYPSCWEIYSGYAGTLYANESTPALPRGPFGEAKCFAETMINHSRSTAGLQCALLRSSFIYGAGNDRPKFLYNFIDKAARSDTIVTHHYRNGEPALDLMYIDDFISALIAAIESQFSGTVNLGTGALTSTCLIAKMVVDRLLGDCRIENISIDANFASVAMDWGYAQKVLDWQPTIPLEDGLKLVLSEIT